VLFIMLYFCSSLNGQCLTNYSDHFDPTCSESDPYCVPPVPSSPTAAPTLSGTCVACWSSCDCKIGQYCSTDSSSYHECEDIPSSLSGSTCLPFSTADLANDKYPSSLKCAVTYVNALNTTIIDWKGTCRSGVCVTGGTSDDCSYTSGLGPARQASRDSEFQDQSNTWYNWSVYVLNNDPEGVWLTILWILISFMAITQIIGVTFLCVRMKRGGGTTNKVEMKETNTPAAKAPDNTNPPSHAPPPQPTTPMQPPPQSYPPPQQQQQYNYDPAYENQGGTQPLPSYTEPPQEEQFTEEYPPENQQ